ncbi:MAG: hypothetical protein KKC64_06315, partial [Spirochaetes bacterium]|nr:hypothetical protein [Spirochaetota bacterium]
FHEGSQISAHDVKFSLERLMNPVLQSPYANMFSIIEGADQYIEGKAGSVSGIRVINNLTINITLKNTFNFFLGMLALTFSSIIKSDRSKFSQAISKDCLISAGPFRVLDSGNAEIDLLEANPDFVNGRPFIDRLEIRRNLPDLAQGLIDEEIDLGYNLPALSADVFKEAGFKGKTKYYTSRYCYGMLVNYKRSNIITRNAELRRALVMSINKDEMISTYLKGNAVRADSVLPPETFDTGGRVFIKHDIEKAAEIAEALRSREDFSQPLKLALRSYITLPRLPEMGQRIAESFARLGIRVEISIHPATSQIAEFVDDYDLVFLGFLSEIDLYSALEPFINPEGGDNYFGYNNQSILKMLEDSITIKDNAMRRQVFLKILEDLTLDVFMIPLFFQKVLCVSSMQVHSVFLSAEESFIPEAVYLSAQYSAESSAETAHNSKSDSEYSKTYSSVVNRLDEITGTIVASSNELINKGKDISRTIIEQKSGITAATELFDSFSASAGKVRQSRTEVVEQIRQTATQAGRSSQAAQLINNGLAELMHAINGTLLALNQVKKDISTMLKVARSISESNSFIGSVAINAAIISTKTDVRGGDLIKVSQSISEQALRNTEYTEASQHILDQMNKKVLDNIEVLGKLINNLELASASINQSGTVLDKVGPLLNTGTEKSRVMESAASRLETYIADALQSVDKINQEGTQLALSAETLEFGLDMEQAVADILKDVSWINKDIRDFHLKTQ